MQNTRSDQEKQQEEKSNKRKIEKNIHKHRGKNDSNGRSQKVLERNFTTRL